MPWQPFVWGGAAAMAAEAVTYPLDTSKTRLQIQGQTADIRLSAKRYKGMCHTLATVAKEEGAGALLKGVRFAFLRQATYGTLRLGVYYNLKAEWERRYVKMPLTHLVALGSGVGVVGAFLTTPAEVLRVRAQVAASPIPQNSGSEQQTSTNFPDQKHASSSKQPHSISRGVLQIYQTEGLRGLYRGAVPNAQRAGVVNGVEIPTYDACKRWLVSHGLGEGDSMGLHLGCSMCAGLTSACFSQPIDVARTRMMNQKVGDGDVRLYKGVVDTMYQTVRYEGVAALWKGFTPTFCRLTPWNVVFFMTFEQLKRLDNFIV